MLIEYRIKPITRYIVTRYETTGPDENGRGSGSTSQIGGEYDNGEIAFQVAYAVCKVEHEKLGWSPDDERIQYPRHPREADVLSDPTTVPYPGNHANPAMIDLLSAQGQEEFRRTYHLPSQTGAMQGMQHGMSSAMNMKAER